jgi:hypothetical protein
MNKTGESSLFAINQEVFHETQILIANLRDKFKTGGESLANANGLEQREFL